MDALFLGLDVGTSGVRTSVIDGEGNEVATASVKMESPVEVDGRPCQSPMIWWDAARKCLTKQAVALAQTGRDLRAVEALSVDGTSGTLLLCDPELHPVTPGYMYNSGGFVDEAKRIAAVAGDQNIAAGSGSTLARLLFLQEHVESKRAVFAMHQADWIAAKIGTRSDIAVSDETNALKMGYDVINRCWPDWISDCGVRTNLLPSVRPVGETIGGVDGEFAEEVGFRPETRIVAGTTDSCAAFLASGANRVGDGVTSLGTTLAIKLLSEKPIVDRSVGVYSHRIKDMWLPGGASNSGGGVIAAMFTAEQIETLQVQVDPSSPTGLDFYPLLKPGERFPIADSSLQPRMGPRPECDVVFFQAILEGISEIEKAGYEALAQRGAASLKRVFTAGGGAKNQAWTRIRQQKLGVPIVQSKSSEAAYGVARVAAGLV